MIQVEIFALIANSSFVNSNNSALNLENREEEFNSLGLQYVGTQPGAEGKTDLQKMTKLEHVHELVLFYRNAKGSDQNISHTNSTFPWVSLSHSIFSKFSLSGVLHLCVITE